MDKIWKDIPDYEGLYQVSNYGEVKSFKNVKERLLKPNNINNTYLSYTLSNSGKLKTFLAHQLVAMAFLGHKPDGHKIVINHIDNNQLNNYITNLELVSNRYNSSCHKTDVGVSWCKRDNIWRSRIVVKDKIIYLGRYINKQDGLNIYKKAVENIHLYDGDNKKFKNYLNNLE